MTYTKKYMLPAAGVLAFGASLSGCVQNTQKPSGYNIIYIMTDDHTAQIMSCYDRSYIETPNLDNLYGRSGYEDITADLKRRMDDLQEQYGDPVRISPDKDRDSIQF